MGDRYANFANSGMGRGVVKRLGLPDPPRLRRYHVGDPLTNGPVLLGGAPPGPGLSAPPVGPGAGGSTAGRVAATVAKLVETTDAFDDQTRYGALVFDAS